MYKENTELYLIVYIMQIQVKVLNKERERNYLISSRVRPAFSAVLGFLDAMTFLLCSCASHMYEVKNSSLGLVAIFSVSRITLDM